jgi:hypothetical protein
MRQGHCSFTTGMERKPAVDVVNEMTQAVVVVPRIIERPEKSAEHLLVYVFFRFAGSFVGVAVIWRWRVKVVRRATAWQPSL